MNKRLKLDAILRSICQNVYFQPPSSVMMKYPCIVYEYSGEKPIHADDGKFILWERYTVTVIDKNPDTELKDKVGAIQHCSFSRPFKSDNLNHYVYDLYL